MKQLTLLIEDNDYDKLEEVRTYYNKTLTPEGMRLAPDRTIVETASIFIHRGLKV